jgi:LCP family protein required for cell wall assembly
MNSEHPEQTVRPGWFARHRTLVLSGSAGAVLVVGALATVVFGVWNPAPNASASASSTLQPAPTASPPEPTPTPQPTPTPNPFDRAMLNTRYTVLVIGEDSDLRREGLGKTTRTDTMMVVSLSPRQKQVTMLSIPRDMVDIPLANGSVFPEKMNGIAETYGYDGLAGAVGTMLAIDIDAYVKVDMDNFVQLVDAVGGVRVTNTEYLYDEHLGLSLAPGTYKLDGATALDYVRSRYTTNDYARAARQQQVLLALVRKYLNPSTDWDLDQILLMLDSLQTNVDLADITTLMEMGRRTKKAEVTTMVLSPPRFALTWGDQHDGRGWVIIPNLAEMRAYAASVMGD